jgi:hypothetical protein
MAESNEFTSAGLHDPLGRLPREIMPPHDAWPAIQARIRRRERNGSAWSWALAASVVALGFGIWIGRGMTPLVPVAGGPGMGVAAGTYSTLSPAGAASATGALRDVAYERERQRALRGVLAQIDALPAESRLQVRNSLATIQHSIEQIRSALARDPANALLQELLTNAYGDEMRIVTSIEETASGWAL